VERLRQSFAKIYLVVKAAVKEFFADDGLNLSASMAFFAIMSVIPISMILISVVGHYIGQSEELFGEISGWVMKTIPIVQPDFIQFLRTLVDKKLTSGWVGIVFLFFIAHVLFTDIEHILDKILKSERKRNFWHSRVLSIGFIFLTCVVLFALIVFKVAAQYLSRYGISAEQYSVIQGNMSYFLAHFMVFVLLLKFAPNEFIRMKNILIGALVFAGMTVSASLLFRWYVQAALDRYHFIYGSLTVLVMLVLWIYYLSIIFVFSAELVNALQRSNAPESRSE